MDGHGAKFTGVEFRSIDAQAGLGEENRAARTAPQALDFDDDERANYSGALSASGIW